MGEILGLGMTHFPGLVGRDEQMPSPLRHVLKHPALPERYKRPENWPEPMQREWEDVENAATRHREACVREFRKQREVLDDFDPDVVLIWGDDQYENFQAGCIPSFSVMAYGTVETRPWAKKQTHEGGQLQRFGYTLGNYWEEPESKVFVTKGHREMAKGLTTELLEAGFDVAYGYEPLYYDGLAHPFINTVMYLDYDRDKGWPYPVVPFHVNCYGRKMVSQRAEFPAFDKPLEREEAELDPPSPMPWRCFDMGREIARIVERSPWRVALIASSSWSHAFLSPETNYIHPHHESNRVLYEALREGDYDTWREYPLENIENRGQHEMLNWECLVGVMAELGRKPDHTEMVNTYVFNSAKVFATFTP